MPGKTALWKSRGRANCPEKECISGCCMSQPPEFCDKTMHLLSLPTKAIDGFLDRVFAVIGAVVFSQFPAFVAHYVQRLGGHVDEARRSVAEWQTIADRIAGGSLDRLLEMGRSSGGEFGTSAAQKCSADVHRLDHLLDAFNAIHNAGPWSRGLEFLRHMDWDIATAALKAFVPNIPLDPVSLVHAAVGLALGMAVYFLIKRAIRGAWRLARARLFRKHESSPASPPVAG